MSQPPAAPVPQGEPPPDVTDESLLAESLATPERFATIFDRYAPVVHGYLSRRVDAQALRRELARRRPRCPTTYWPRPAPTC